MSTCKCWNEFHTVCQNFSTSPETPRVCQKVWQIHSKQTLNTCAKAKAMRAHKQTHTNGVGNNPPHPRTHTHPQTQAHAQTSRHTESTKMTFIRMRTHAFVNTYVCTYAQLTHLEQSVHTCAVTENMLGELSSSDGYLGTRARTRIPRRF